MRGVFAFPYGGSGDSQTQARFPRLSVIFAQPSASGGLSANHRPPLADACVKIALRRGNHACNWASPDPHLGWRFYFSLPLPLPGWSSVASETSAPQSIHGEKFLLFSLRAPQMKLDPSDLED